MDKIPEKFSGYLHVDSDTFAYFVSDYLVTMLPAQSNIKDIDSIFERVTSRKSDSSEFIFGDNSNHRVAILRNDKFYYDFLGINHSLQFATPLIIMASGNTEGFYNRLTEPWEKFHAITFHGGNINSVYSPRNAVNHEHNFPYDDGTRGIEILPWNDYTFSKDIKLFGEEAQITISVSQSDGNNNSITSGYNLGKLNSIIRLSFNNAQGFEKIEKCYGIVKTLLALLIRENNVSFDLYLSQRLSDNYFYTTAVCKFLDHYENYSNKSDFRVIPLGAIIDYLPKLIQFIEKGETKPIIPLLSDNNKTRNQITITNVQDMCTALEVSYNWKRGKRPKDELIHNLKAKIQSTITEFLNEHSEIDIYKQTTISSSFQYLDFTLKQKILTLYSENIDIIDSITDKLHLKRLDEQTIASFVKLRNGKTHSGTIEWGNCADYYMPLLAIVYSTLFRYAEIPEELIKQLITSLF